VPWPCNDTKYIVHFPETREIWSYGSGYGGNALLGKKCFALRIASTMGRDQGWLAEHMLILGVTDARAAEVPRGGGLPVGLRQDQLRDADPAEGIRRLEGDHRRRRHRLDQAGRRRPAVRDQPGGGLLRRRARHLEKTNANAMATLRENVIFTNVALTDDGDVWWEGMGPSRRRT
jgi:phosphoenolpyruvate carboxykinase (GTP)